MPDKLLGQLISACMEIFPMANYYQFTLLLDGVNSDTPGLEDSLFESGCDDALIKNKSGLVYLDFDRESSSLEQAIVSAINDVETAGINARVTSIEPEHLVNLSDIGERLTLTRQAVSLYVLGKRGKGDFPHPVIKIHSKSALWKWSAVAQWFYEQGKINNPSIVNDARTIETINSVLNARMEHHFTDKQRIENSLIINRFE